MNRGEASLKKVAGCKPAASVSTSIYELSKFVASTNFCNCNHDQNLVDIINSFQATNILAQLLHMEPDVCETMVHGRDHVCCSYTYGTM